MSFNLNIGVAVKNNQIWLGRLDSNQRMTVSKTVALPLGDAPIMMI
jgi:hypothetical protein